MTRLDGERVVVTRAAAQAGALRSAFEDAGARVELLPLLEVRPPADTTSLDRAAAAVASFDRLIFTSANAVETFLARVPSIAALPAVAVVGPATADRVRAFGVEPHLVAAKARGTGLVEALRGSLATGHKVLVPQADDARPEVVAGLQALGVEVTAVVAYTKSLPATSAALAERLFARELLGWVTFTSPRICRHFAELLGESWTERRGELRAISIGPVTTAELRRLGVEAIAEASHPTPEEMVQAALAVRTIC